MTVAELIERLEKYHPDAEVVFEAEDDGELWCYDVAGVGIGVVHEGKKIVDEDDAAAVGVTDKCVIINSNWS